MKKTAIFLCICSSVFAQNVKSKKEIPKISVKNSPAEISLINASKDYSAKQKDYNDILQKDKENLQSNQKSTIAQLNAVQKELNDKLKLDEKYKPMVDRIVSLEKNLSDASAQAEEKFNQDTLPMQKEIMSDKALISGLVPVVRQENNIPESYLFNIDTQVWVEGKDLPKK